MICARCGECEVVVYLVVWFRGYLCDKCYDMLKPKTSEWKLIERRNAEWLNQQQERLPFIRSGK